MGLADELVSVASETSIGSGGGNMAATFGLLVIAILMFGAITIMLIQLSKNNKYGITANVFVPTNSGYRLRKFRAGIVPNPKTGKPEFRLKKPNLTINYYNAEWIIPSGKKGLRGAFARDECYLINTALNKFEMLNPIVLREDGSDIAFVAKNIGKDRQSEILDAQIESLFNVDNFLNKYGIVLFYSSMVLVQIIMCIVLVQASNKIMGA